MKERILFRKAQRLLVEIRIQWVWGALLLWLFMPPAGLAQTADSTPPASPGRVGLSGFQGGLGNNSTWLLPDLRTLPPSDLNLEVSQGGQRKLIRFTNAVWNSGPGPLELRGSYQPGDDTISVFQIVYRLNGGIASRLMDKFVYHPEHEHWHWQNFALYQVWSLHSDGTLDQVVASSDKIGFCSRDDDNLQAEQPQPDLPERGFGSLRPTYGSCHWERQGISVGWVDIYREHLSDQYVVVSDLPQGVYALKSAANPDHQLLEANRENNAALVYFALRETTLQVLDGPPEPPEDPPWVGCDCLE
jgi:hypothetical protein